MPENDELDLLLDAALSTYADPGPDSGLEQRVLAAIRMAGETEGAETVRTQRRHWLPWAIAVPLAAGMLILWLSFGRVVHVPSTQPQLALHANTPLNEPHTAEIPVPAHPEHPSAAKAHHEFAAVSARLKSCPFKTTDAANCAPLPKLDVFPTPIPPSAEERALVAVANTGPASQRQALIASQQHTDAPLSIAALNIPPLAVPGEGKN